MKRIFAILLLVGLTVGANAQRGHSGHTGHSGGGVHVVRPHVTVVAPVYPYYGLGYGYGYSPFGYDPFYSFPPAFESRPSQLDLQEDEIKNDYSHQISTVRHDKSLSRDVRNQKIRDLKHDRDEAIIEAKKDYYKAENK